MMKFVLAITTLVLFVKTIECTSPSCGCWPGYEPSSESGRAVCRGTKTKLIVDCNEPTIPQCECSHNGKVVRQDLGIVDCARVSGKPNCDNAKDFEAYFSRHPERRIQI